MTFYDSVKVMIKKEASKNIIKKGRNIIRQKKKESREREKKAKQCKRCVSVDLCRQRESDDFKKGTRGNMIQKRRKE